MPRLLGLGKPHLHAHRPGALEVRAGVDAQLGMGDAIACRHEVELPRSDELLGSQRVAVESRSGEEPRHRREPDVWVWPDLQGRGFGEIARAHQVHEAPRTDRSPALRRKHAHDPHLADLGLTALANDDGLCPEVGRCRLSISDGTAHASNPIDQPPAVQRLRSCVTAVHPGGPQLRKNGVGIGS